MNILCLGKNNRNNNNNSKTQGKKVLNFVWHASSRSEAKEGTGLSENIWNGTV